MGYEELLLQEIKRLNAKVIDLYNFHDVRIDEFSIENIIVRDFRRQIQKKVKNSFISEFEKFLKMAYHAYKSVDLKFSNVEEANKLLNNINSFIEVVDKIFLEFNNKLVTLNFEDEKNECLKNICRQDMVIDPDLRMDLKKIFFSVEMVEEPIILHLKNRLKKAKEIIDEKNDEIKHAVYKYLEDEKELSNIKNDESLPNFLQAREEQQLIDKNDREMQYKSRNEIIQSKLNNGFELSQGGKSL